HPPIRPESGPTPRSFLPLGPRFFLNFSDRGLTKVAPATYGRCGFLGLFATPFIASARGGANRMPTAVAKPSSRDEQRLAELGYKQSLNRAWSGFSNFAISFTIISILAGCFTTYGQAWNNGGPIAISLGWPLISIPILIIGFCLSELVSAYPTAGGIYWF